MQLALTRSKKVAHPRHGAPSTLEEGALDFGLWTETECSSSLRGSKEEFPNRPETHARVCALVRGFFAAGSEVFLFARLDLGAMDRAPHSNGLNLESRRERPPRGGQPPAKTMWPSAEWGRLCRLRTPSSCRIVAAVHLSVLSVY